MYETVLAPVDGSDNSRLAARRAIQTAARDDATLHVLFVVEGSRDEPTQTGYEKHLNLRESDGEDIVESVAERAASEGVESVSAVEHGVARTTIEEYATEHDIDVVVIGSTGASGPTEKLLGTVSKYVVNEAPADVLVVRPDEPLE